MAWVAVGVRSALERGTTTVGEPHIEHVVTLSGRCLVVGVGVEIDRPLLRATNSVCNAVAVDSILAPATNAAAIIAEVFCKSRIEY